MNSATIALTSEQKAIIAEKMGLVSDELVLTSLSSTQDVAQIEDIGENLFLAASKPFTVSKRIRVEPLDYCSNFLIGGYNSDGSTRLYSLVEEDELLASIRG